MTEKQMKEFEEAARPLIKWLCENRNPHDIVIVEPESVQLKDGHCRVNVTDYIPD